MVVQEKRNRLFEIVESQHGIFTTKQAVEAGYNRNTHAYQVKMGYWIREYRGIYRLAHYHYDEESEWVIWSLWARSRAGKSLGVYSHDTALAMYDLSDANPPKLHMTVSRSFRKNSLIPTHLCIHIGMLNPDDIEERLGYRVTTPFRTIQDLCREGTVDRDLVRQAITQGVRRGLISQSARKKAMKSSAFPEWAKHIFENDT